LRRNRREKAAAGRQVSVYWSQVTASTRDGLRLHCAFRHLHVRWPLVEYEPHWPIARQFRGRRAIIMAAINTSFTSD
jgi:hypothetical protein